MCTIVLFAQYFQAWCLAILNFSKVECISIFITVDHPFKCYICRCTVANYSIVLARYCLHFVTTILCYTYDMIWCQYNDYFYGNFQAWGVGGWGQWLPPPFWIINVPKKDKISTCQTVLNGLKYERQHYYYRSVWV